MSDVEVQALLGDEPDAPDLLNNLAAAYEQLYRDAMARTPAAEPVRSGA